MGTVAGKPEVFSRKSSGLVRVMSVRSAFFYNVLSMGVIWPWVYVWAPAAFPGVSVWLTVIVAMLIEIPIAFTYVYLASSMPRSGGDYVFQSRLLGGAFGFPIVMSGFVIWVVQWLILGGWLFTTVGLGPMLVGLGVHYDSNGLVDAGVWVTSTTGIVTVTIAVMAAMTFLLITGMKNYVRFQYFAVLFVGTVVVVMIVQFLRTSPADFAAAINDYAVRLDQNPDFYAWLQNDVTSAGGNILPKLSLAATLLAAPYAWTALQWASWSVEQGGEVKSAGSFKSQLVMILGALGLVTAIYSIIGVLEVRAVGSSFFNAASLSYWNGISASGEGTGSILPFPAVFAAIISPHPIIVILIGLGFMFAAMQIMCNSIIGPTRIVVAMSLDRTLPKVLSHVDARFHTPVVAMVIYFLLGVAWCFAYNYWSTWGTLTIGVTFACGYVFAITCLAGALMPYRAKALYDAAPFSHHKILGLPAVTVVGAVGLLTSVSALVLLVSRPEYGLTGWTSYLIVAGIVVVCAVGYWIGRIYQRGKGIELSHAFLEIPPE